MFMTFKKSDFLLLDYDSISPDNRIEILSLSQNFQMGIFTTENLEDISEINDYNLKVVNESPFDFFLSRDTLTRILAACEVDACNCRIISENIEHLSWFSENYISTIYYTKKTLSFDLLGYLPDFIIDSTGKLKLILEGSYIGYISEYNSELDNNGRKGTSGQLKIVRLENLFQNPNIELISGGRYYGKSHSVYKMNQLSLRIKKSKNDSSQENIFLEIYKQIIRFLIKIQNLDKCSVLAVPPRPGDINRFGNIIDEISKEFSLENLTSSVECIKNYSKMKFLNSAQRKIEISGAFRVSRNLENKTIFLIDDVFTTGSTMQEVSEQLILAGAKKIICIVLASNQFSYNIPTDIKLNIPCLCGGELYLRFRKKDNGCFWGCSEFYNKGCNQLQFYDRGIEHLINQINFQYKLDEDNDLETIF